MVTHIGSRMIPFYKMHGLGNDFVLIYNHPEITNLISFQQVANCHIGIGFDQLIIITPSNIAHFACRIYNADGTEAEQCGNGMRCVARFVHEEKLINTSEIKLETRSGIVHANIHDYENIEVTLGLPTFEPNLSIENLNLSIISLGNPHAILQVDSIESYPVNEVSALISAHKAFPQGVNIGFMQVIDRNHIRLRTIERGVGETLSCGSNTCAAVAIGIVQDLLASDVTVELTLGNLHVSWPDQKKPIKLRGPATRVFTGYLEK